jgi:c-di-GMP-binding flagellar brake protein YcgR
VHVDEQPVGIDEEPDAEDEVGRAQRQNVRVDVQLPLTLSLNGRQVPARTRDVSATGVGFSTRIPVAVDQRGEVTVHFEHWRIHKQFTIRFVRPILAGYHVGVQFDELTEDERERLVRTVFDLQRSQLQSAKLNARGK